MRRLLIGLLVGIVLALASLVAAPLGFSHVALTLPRAQSSRVVSTSALPPAGAGQRARLALRPRQASIARFTATPFVLSASGGRVRLKVVVHGATKCRFSSARTQKGLPSTKSCASGNASVTVELPENLTSSTRIYLFYVTVRGTRGTSTARRVVVLERAPATSGLAPVATNEPASQAVAPQAVAPQAVAPQAVAPVITMQPANVSVYPGNGASFSASASGNPIPSVQWQISTDGGSAWQDIAGASTASYVLVPYAAENDDEYRAVFTNAVGSATTNAATLTVEHISTYRFSGYFDFAPSGKSFSAVRASWIVPTVSCPPGANSWAAEWPGIGWETSVVQDGTQVACFSGSPSYSAWYEMVGDPSVNNGEPFTLPSLSYPVSPGDAITASVGISGSTWTLSLKDATAPWSWSQGFPSPTPPLSQAAAQVFVEGPEDCASGCYALANFGAVRFTGATADLSGQTGPISAFNPVAYQMISGSTVLAASGPFDATGEDFTDTWYAN